MDPMFRGFLLCTVNQLLASDAVANPGNGLQTLGVNLLLAAEALAKPTFADPFQRRVDCAQQRSVPRFLAEVYFFCQRRFARSPSSLP